MEPPLHMNMQGGSIYPEQAQRVEGTLRSFDALRLLRIVVSEQSESNHDFAQGKCAKNVQRHLWAHLEICPATVLTPARRVRYGCLKLFYVSLSAGI